MGAVGFLVSFAGGQAGGCGSLHGEALGVGGWVRIEKGTVQFPRCRSGTWPTRENAVAMDDGGVSCPKGVGNSFEVWVFPHGGERGPVTVGREEVIYRCFG